MQNKLTDIKLRNLEPTEKEQIIGDGGGLWIRVLSASKGGAINFYYRFNSSGKERRFNCGTYPETSLANARSRRDAARDLVAAGIDPVEKEQQDKLTNAAKLATEKMEKTVRELFEDWHSVYLSTNRKDGGAGVRAAMELHVLDEIGNLRARDVRIGHVIKVLDRVVAGGARRTGNMLLSLLRQMFRHGLARGLVELDPTLGLSKKQVGGKESPKTRNLSIYELDLLSGKLPVSGLTEGLQAAIWFLLATGARVGELAKARWTEVDEKARTWRIPAENAKNGHEHICHLSDFALKQLKVFAKLRESDYLIAGRKVGEPMDDKTLSKAIRDRQRSAPLEKRTSMTGALNLPGGAWTPHDLRRTFSSRLGDLGVQPHVIERCLNHVPQGIVAVYQRQDYLKERKAALEKLGKRLSEIFSGEARAEENRAAESSPPAYLVRRRRRRDGQDAVVRP